MRAHKAASVACTRSEPAGPPAGMATESRRPAALGGGQTVAWSPGYRGRPQASIIIVDCCAIWVAPGFGLRWPNPPGARGIKVGIAWRSRRAACASWVARTGCSWGTVTSDTGHPPPRPGGRQRTAAPISLARSAWNIVWRHGAVPHIDQGRSQPGPRQPRANCLSHETHACRRRPLGPRHL